MKLILSTLAIFIFVQTTTAQDDCHNSLYEANRLFESGQIDDAKSLLEPCLTSNKLSGNEKFDATRLMALCNIYLNKSDSAEVYVRKMLEIRPDYQQFHYVDPRELTTLVNRYTVRNMLNIGLMAGAGTSQANVIKNYSTANTPSTYFSDLGLQAGIIAEYKWKPSISFLLEPNLNSMSYRREQDNIAGRKSDFSELINTLEIPLSVRYYKRLGGINLFAQAGFQWNNWMNSYADVQSTNLNDLTVHQSSTETTEYRSKSITGFNVGVGFARPLGDGTFSASIRYRSFGANVVLPERRYDNVDFILSSQYIDSDYSLSYVGMNIAYQLPALYKVKKGND